MDKLSLIQRLQHFAEYTPKQDALVFDAGCISYQQLFLLVQRQADCLYQRGIKAGDVVGIACADEPQHIVLCLGAIYIGATSVTLPVNEADVVQTRLHAYVKHIHVLDSSIPLMVGDYQTTEGEYRQPAAFAQVLFSTSGTTGEPKWVIHTDTGLVEQAHRHINSSQERFACIASVEQNFAKRHRLYCLAMGASNIFIDANKAIAPQSQQLGVNVLHVSAFQAQQLLAEPDVKALAAIRLKLGGSHVTIALRHALRTGISTQLQAGYGTTETGAIAFTDPTDTEAAESVGQALPGINVEVVDARRQSLPQGEMGELAISCAGMFTGYLARQALTDERLHNGWFYTGDVGYIDAAQRIHLCGRLDDMFVFNSMNIYPQDIESVLLAYAGVKELVVVPKPSPVHGNIPVALVVAACNTNLDLQALQLFARQQLGARCPRQFVVLDALPLNSAGKLLRKQAATLITYNERVREGLIQALRDAKVLTEQHAHIVQAFLDEAADIDLNDLPIDSHARMDLLVAIELNYGCIISPEQLSGLVSLEGITDYILQHTQLTQAGVDNTEYDSHHENLETASTIIKTVWRALRCTHNATQLNQLVSALTFRLLPQQVNDIVSAYPLLRSALVPAQHSYLDLVYRRLKDIQHLMQQAAKPKPEMFSAYRLSPALHYFKGAGDTHNKTLLVCCSLQGGVNNAAMPLAVFLQHIDASQYDVLFVSDLANDAYWAGVPFMGQNMTESAKAIAALPVVKRYSSVHTAGCSAGAYLALLMAYYLKAQSALSIGGRFHKERYPLKIAGKLLGVWRASRNGHKPQVLFAYSADISRDRIYAKLMAFLSKGAIKAVALDQQNVTHNILDSLLEQDELSTFFDDTLFKAQ